MEGLQATCQCQQSLVHINGGTGEAKLPPVKFTVCGSEDGEWRPGLNQRPKTKTKVCNCIKKMTAFLQGSANHSVTVSYIVAHDKTSVCIPQLYHAIGPSCGNTSTVCCKCHRMNGHVLAMYTDIQLQYKMMIASHLYDMYDPYDQSKGKG